MIGRRRLLTAGLAGLAAMPLLAACGGAASAPTAAPKGESKPAPAATTAPGANAPGSPAPAGGAATKPAAGAATPAAQTAAKPAAPAAGRVTIVMGQQPDTLMPRIGSMMARTEVLGALQTRAVATDDQGKFIAMGVEQVPSFENGGAKWVGDGDDKHLEVTFKVKKGLKWHDGNPVTSKDVKFA